MLTPYTGIFGREEITHLLNRTLFGARKGDIDFFSTKTLAETVDTLLAPSQKAQSPTPPLKNYFNPNDNPDPEVLQGETWVNTFDNSLSNGRRKAAFKAWWVGLMLHQERDILEKMVLFWHNHFPIDMDDRSAIMAYIYNRTLRQHALGNFKTFVKAITLDPMMLRYLNGASNNTSAADENYARELQELFTLGKSVNAQFTEEDVRAAARILTGYQITIQTPTVPFEAVFNPLRHDATDKQFSAFYNNTIIKGRAGTEGVKELDDLLEMIFKQPEVALFICRKIYRFFIYHKIDDTVEKDVIQPLATLFRSKNYEIKPVLAALFTSSHFFEPRFRGCMIKSPIDYVVGLGRTFDIQLPTIKADNFSSVVDTYAAWYSFHVFDTNGAAAQRQNLADPPSVAGWSAYYQEPNYYRLWLDTDTYPKRIRFAATLLNKVWYFAYINPLTFTAQFASANDADKLIEDTLKILVQVPVSQAFTQQLKQLLLSGQTNDYYWTEAWQRYKNDPTATNTTVVETRLKALYQAIILKPEFQLM